MANNREIYTGCGSEIENMADIDFIKSIIKRQREWRDNCINLVASENITSAAVRDAVASDFGHRYAEGLVLGKDRDGLQMFDRFYQGTKIYDEIERIAIKLTEYLFNANYANVVPISGAVANLTAYYALAKPGDTIASLSVLSGAHISHTRISAAGVMNLRDVEYPYDEHEMNIDIDKTIRLILREKPRISILGGSVILFPQPVSEIRDAVSEVGGVLLYDAAHVLGLIAGERFQKPLEEGADIITSSTHKTFPGPQGGVIMWNEQKLNSKINNAAFPGLMSNHHLHHVAGYAISLAEMIKFGKDYAAMMIDNAKALAGALYDAGFDVLCEHRGFTQSHQVLINVSGLCGGSKIAELLEDANIIVNKNLMPWDSLHDTDNPSGIRIGTAEITHMGMKPADMKDIAEFIKRAAISGEPAEKVREDVVEFKRNFSEIKFCF